MVPERGTGLELGKVPPQEPGQDLQASKHSGRNQEAAQRRSRLGWGLCLQVLTFSHVHTTALSQHWGQASRGHSTSAPWDPWLHGALTMPGDSGLCNIAGCQVIHQEVSVSLEPSPTHTPRGVPWREPYSQDECAQNKPAQRPLA